MKDYLRLIGITNERATEDQIRQAHFRTFRYYQGRKNESKSPVERSVAELAIDYLRNAQYDQNLPIPASIKQLLPPDTPPTAGIAHRERLIDFDGIFFIVRYPDDDKLANSVQSLPNARFDASNKQWRVPATIEVVQHILTFVKTFYFKLSNEASVQLERLIETEKNRRVTPIVAKPVVAKPAPPEPSIYNMPKIADSSDDDDYVPPTDDLGVPKRAKPAIPVVPEPVEAIVPPPIVEEKIPPTQKVAPITGNYAQTDPLAFKTRPLNPELLRQAKAAPSIDESAINEPSTSTNVVPTSTNEASLPLASSPTDVKAAENVATSSPAAEDSNEDISLDLDFDNSNISPTPISPPEQPGAVPNEVVAQFVDKPAELAPGIPANTTGEFPAQLFKELSRSGHHMVLGSVINCPDCEWEILSQTDSYCSGCGKSIASIAIPRELIVYISENTSYAKRFTLVNDGLIPISISAFEITEIEATIHPNQAMILGKNETLNLELRVSEKNPFGRRNGRIRFTYHEKLIEIPVQLKEPPIINLSFSNVPNLKETVNGFVLYLPITQRSIICCLETNSELSLRIASISIGSKVLNNDEVVIEKHHSYQFEIDSSLCKDGTITINFHELGSRQFHIKSNFVETPNITDQVECVHIGEQSIIIGSGAFQTTLTLKNSFDKTTGRGKGRAEKISFSGLPEWLKLIPNQIDRLASEESKNICLEIDTNKISAASKEYCQLVIHYYDPQLGCEQRREEPLKLTYEFIEPREYHDWIAIDFGTSNSCAAIISGSLIRSLEIDAANFNANPSESPTCIQFVDEAKQSYECGMSAYTKRFSGQRALKSTAWAFKPLLSRVPESFTHSYLDIMQGRVHSKSVDELITIYAHSLLEGIKLRNGLIPRKAIITYPITFGKLQRDRLAMAFRAAGLRDVVTLVSEPVALAIHYAYLHPDIFTKSATFAVFDFGGGTTDLAIFEVHPVSPGHDKPRFKLLDVSGVDIGGEKLTFEIAKFVYNLLVPNTQRSDFSFPSSLDELMTSNNDIARENYRHLAVYAEQIKRSFNGEGYVDQEITQNLAGNNKNQTLKAQLLSNDIESVLRTNIEQLIRALIEMLTGLNNRGLIAACKLDWILLGGNSSRLPLVTHMIANAFFEGDKSRVLLDNENIKYGVTKGALLYAVAPEALPFPIDEISHTLPCRVGIITTGFRFDTIFERGIISGSEHAHVVKKITLPAGRDNMRIYYYFGHEAEPKIIDNAKVKEHVIHFPKLVGGELTMSFQLLPECAGIEISMVIDGQEIKQLAPIMGAG